jgi:hypothetical protein
VQTLQARVAAPAPAQRRGAPAPDVIAAQRAWHARVIHADDALQRTHHHGGRRKLDTVSFSRRDGRKCVFFCARFAPRLA